MQGQIVSYASFHVKVHVMSPLGSSVLPSLLFLALSRPN